MKNNHIEVFLFTRLNIGINLKNPGKLKTRIVNTRKKRLKYPEIKKIS